MSKLAIIIATTLALSAGVAQAQPSLTETGVHSPSHTVTATVRYGDLDLATSDGTAALKRRIHSAARAVCDSPPTIADLAEYEDYHGCLAKAEFSAQPQVERAIAEAQKSIVARYGFQ
jgi:UrcA family protein